MNKIVKLYNTVGRLTNREPFILQDGEDFLLDLDCDVVINDCRVIYTKDGIKKTQHFTTPDLKQIKIPETFVNIGTLEVEIDILSHGNVIRRHYVDPITFVAVDEGFKGHLEFEELKAKQELLEQTITAQNELIETLVQRLGIVEQQVQEIWEYEEQ